MDMPLQEWAAQNACFVEQVMFVRDVLTRLVGTGLDFHDCIKIPRVISTHVSHGRTLPVYSLSRPDIGVRFVLRDNNYNWKLSVVSERPVETPALAYLFETEPPREPDYTGDDLSAVYFEGFPPDLIFGYYSADRCRWSAQIHGDHALWAVVFEVMRSLGWMRVKRAVTRVEHEVQLAAETARFKAEQAKRRTSAVASQ